jgi:hypothetical protein
MPAARCMRSFAAKVDSGCRVQKSVITRGYHTHRQTVDLYLWRFLIIRGVRHGAAFATWRRAERGLFETPFCFEEGLLNAELTASPRRAAYATLRSGPVSS